MRFPNSRSKMSIGGTGLHEFIQRRGDDQEHYRLRRMLAVLWRVTSNLAAPMHHVTVYFLGTLFRWGRPSAGNLYVESFVVRTNVPDALWQHMHSSKGLIRRVKFGGHHNVVKC